MVSACEDALFCNSGNWCPQKNGHAGKFRRANQLAMQFDSPHAESCGRAKFRLCNCIAFYQTYSAKGSARGPIQRYAESLQRRDPFRQNPLAACFVARCISAVGNGYAQALVAQRNRCNKAGGTSSNYKRVF